MTEATTLYLVHVDPELAPEAEALPGLRRLAPGLYLAESVQSRSQFYHALKRRLRPARLLVAALADEPKFKGMDAGALAWLRRRRAPAPSHR